MEQNGAKFLELLGTITLVSILISYARKNLIPNVELFLIRLKIMVKRIISA